MKQKREFGWVIQMADTLTCEIAEQMCGIRLNSRTQEGRSVPPMDVVYGVVEGRYRMHLRFRAEPRLFCRLAENMIGAPPESMEEVQEYATEFFNVLCGRFISEIYRQTKLSARFYPTRYRRASATPNLEERDTVVTRYYVSEQEELAEFSWAASLYEYLQKGVE